MSASEGSRWVGSEGGTGGATATLSPNVEPGPRLRKMEKQNNKETEKKCRKNSVYKQYSDIAMFA